MSNDGKKLEELVAFVEATLLPPGFRVDMHRPVYTEDGVQIAELDIVITGKLGSGEYKWLIECRDRPSQGSAPVSWIEQLVGRRQRFGFNKVTAVSTTGFSPGAVEYAERIDAKIELRAVRDLVPGELNWIAINNGFGFEERYHQIFACNVFVDESTPPNQHRVINEMLATMTNNRPYIGHTQSGNVFSTEDIFLNTLRDSGAFDRLVPNADPQPVQINLPKGHCFVIDTNDGPVRLLNVQISGNIQITHGVLDELSGYEASGSDTAGISQMAKFKVTGPDGVTTSVQFHRIAGPTRYKSLCKTTGRANQDNLGSCTSYFGAGFKRY